MPHTLGRPDEAPKPLSCGLEELPRLVIVAYHFQDGRDWCGRELTLGEAREIGAGQQRLGPLSCNVEVYDAATREWLETWYPDGSVMRKGEGGWTRAW